MKDNRYDIWSCARCGRELTVPSLPLQWPQCCGTVMWFMKIIESTPYEVQASK